MINTMTTTRWTLTPVSDFGMPVNGRVRIAQPSALPVITGVVCADIADPKSGDTTVQGTAVAGYRHIAGAGVVLTGAFPGTSAWSPPI